jgi:hypothetical protein
MGPNIRDFEGYFFLFAAFQPQLHINKAQPQGAFEIVQSVRKGYVQNK